MRIVRVVLRVSDLARSAAFYERVVGLVHDGAGGLAAPDGTEPLLELRAGACAARAPVYASGLFHTAFLYPARAGLAAALRRCRTELTGASDHLVSEAIYLRDPDGLGVELYIDRPREQWPAPSSPGDRVGMATLPLDLVNLRNADDGAQTSAASAGVTVGHIHLKTGDVLAAERFWTEAMGLDLMVRFGPDAVFLAADGYHHHVGVNQWESRGAPPAALDAPGIDAVVIADHGAARELETPDGVRVTVSG